MPFFFVDKVMLYIYHRFPMCDMLLREPNERKLLSRQNRLTRVLLHITVFIAFNIDANRGDYPFLIAQCIGCIDPSWQRCIIY